MVVRFSVKYRQMLTSFITFESLVTFFPLFLSVWRLGFRRLIRGESANASSLRIIWCGENVIVGIVALTAAKDLANII